MSLLWEEIRKSCPRYVERGGGIVPLCLDLEHPEVLENTLKAFVAEKGISISGFVHCAGDVTCLPLRSLKSKDFERSLKVSIVSAAMIFKVLASKIINGDSLKKVVFISSVSSEFGVKGFTAYSASKSALDGFMRSAAVEYEGKVQVNSILPGAINTTNFDISKIPKDEPYNRETGQPSDIANAVVFLMSDKSRWISGQQIVIDGGRSINITQKE